eukprot:481696-Pyramimonas_sp.AAC.1
MAIKLLSILKRLRMKTTVFVSTCSLTTKVSTPCEISKRTEEALRVLDSVEEGRDIRGAPTSNHRLHRMLLSNPTSAKTLTTEDALVCDDDGVQSRSARVPPSLRKALMCQQRSLRIEGPPAGRPVVVQKVA